MTASNPNDEILTYLTTAPASSFAGQKVKLLDHWSGDANLLWRADCRGQEAVLKLYLDAGQVHSRREYDGQALFSLYGLAPQPLWLDRIPETLPRSVLVYSFVEGEPFAVDDLRQWQALAEALAQVHAAPVDGLQRFSPHPVNLSFFWSVLGPSLPPLQQWLANHRLPHLANLVRSLQARGQEVVKVALPLWNRQPVPVHGDLRLANLLNSFGEPVLLDWEQFGLGDPALEVARFLHEQRHAVAASLLDEWLDTYLSASDDDTLPLRIAHYERLLPLQTAAWLLSGAMKLSPDERRSPELRADAASLASTLQQAMAQALRALQAGESQDDNSVAAECAALFSEEISA